MGKGGWLIQVNFVQLIFQKNFLSNYFPNTSGKTMEIYSQSFPESNHQDLKGKSLL